MKFLVFVILVIAFLSVRPGAEAFNDGYQCTALTETSIGYAPGSDRVETGGGNVERPYTVRLSGVVSNTPVLHAQDIVPLSKFGEASNAIWFVEKASAGTIITWTLFEKDGVRPATLISTKSYDLGGAVSFTAFYACK